MVSLTPVTGSPFSTGAAANSLPYSVAFHPSGTLFATANNLGNSGPGSVSLFAVTASGGLQLLGSPVSTGATATTPTSVAFSPDGALLAAANYGGSGNGSVAVFAVASSPPHLAVLQGSPFATGAGEYPFSVAFHSNSKLPFVAAADLTNNNTVSVFSITHPTTGWAVAAPVSFKTGVPLNPQGGGPRELAFHPSGTYLATANSDAGSVSLFTVYGGWHLGLLPPPIPTGPAGVVVNTLAFSPNGHFLATGAGATATATVQMFKFSTIAPYLTPFGAPVSTGAFGATQSVAFSPNGNLLAVASSDNVSLFVVDSTGTLTLQGKPISIPGNPGPRSLAFSPSNKLLAVGCGYWGNGPAVSLLAVT
ncbi:MAG TPA: beta-propeller fold lactonase family protein [Xanthobacteraceae bacterium]|nr:beta-propeller fold lactonase family protein [Xanthobacteraceae bacterium]